MADYNGKLTGPQIDALPNEIKKRIEEAPKDGKNYVRNNGAWVEIDTTINKLQGLLDGVGELLDELNGTEE